MVTIVICYRKGTQKILDLCLKCLAETTTKHQIWIAYTTEKPKCEHKTIQVDVPDELFGSSYHQFMLDEVVPTVETEYVLTLDSDCFVLTDSWLQELVNMDATVAGILQPYIPPQEPLSGIEGRIRNSLNWNHTHVACQLVKTDFLKETGVTYKDGDDTGLAIPILARERGLKVSGWRPVGCCVPNEELEDFDPELNREVCLFYPSVYHHGGASRDEESQGIWTFFSKARKEVLENGPNSVDKYEFVGDREEEVADFKTRMMINQMMQYLQTNKSLF